MTTTDHRPAAGTSLGADVLYAAKYYLGGRRALVLAGSATAAAGLAFNWSWLVAAGFAPLLLSVLPCVAMCALGLCMSRMTGGSCSKETASVGNHGNHACARGHSGANRKKKGTTQMARFTKTIAAAALVAAGLAAAPLYAQDSKGSDTGAGMEGGGMMGQDGASGMMGGQDGMAGMMNMMAQMNEMMTTCNRMMQAMMDGSGKDMPGGSQNATPENG